MKYKFIALLLCLLPLAGAKAQTTFHTIEDLKIGILYVVVYAVLGMTMVFLAFKLIDVLTPGRLSRQIAEEKHLPLAILAAAAILGVSIIVAASIAG